MNRIDRLSKFYAVVSGMTVLIGSLVLLIGGLSLEHNAQSGQGLQQRACQFVLRQEACLLLECGLWDVTVQYNI